MMELVRTNSDNMDFVKLVRLLDEYLAEIDGDEHAFYQQFNKTDKLNHVILAYQDLKAVGCGAIRENAPGVMEVKRMYTLPEERGKGIATAILLGLEDWAKELNYHTCLLETGKRQPEAIELYKKNGYVLIPNFGQYAAIDNSVCFEKQIN
jgi:putative acetyltransferase